MSEREKNEQIINTGRLIPVLTGWESLLEFVGHKRASRLILQICLEAKTVFG